MEIHGRDDTHVGLAPLAAAEGDLAFEELEGVESELRLRDFEGFLEDCGGLVGNEHEVAVRFAFAAFLQDAQEVDAAEEVAPGEGCDGFGWHFGSGYAEFINFGREGNGWCASGERATVLRCFDG